MDVKLEYNNNNNNNNNNSTLKILFTSLLQPRVGAYSTSKLLFLNT
jgi:hypothetical protein